MMFAGWCCGVGFCLLVLLIAGGVFGFGILVFMLVCFVYVLLGL